MKVLRFPVTEMEVDVDLESLTQSSLEAQDRLGAETSRGALLPEIDSSYACPVEHDRRSK